MKILAIETSCDETAVAVLNISGGLKRTKIKILSNIVASQVKIHAKWGGVVPNLAKREHQANLIPILKQTLKESNLLISNFQFSISKPFGKRRMPSKAKRQNLNSKFEILNSILKQEPELLKRLVPFLKKYRAPNIDLIAVTNGPGLEPALWVGINFAMALALFWNKPLIGINHLEGHIFSVFLKNGKEFSISNIQFPILALIVSGGHTELVLMEKWLKYKVIGQTLDDAAGEAFDKVARLLGLGYPGGPAIAAEAAKFKIENLKLKISLPRPMINSKDYNFSFSGLKTAVLYLLRDLKQKPNYSLLVARYGLLQSICAEFQQAVIDVLIKKTIAAAKEYKVKTIILGGGVAANKELRRQLEESIGKLNFENRLSLPSFRSGGRPRLRFSKFISLLMPEMEFTGDNGAMIALAAYFRWQKNKKPLNKLGALKADGNLKLA